MDKRTDRRTAMMIDAALNARAAHSAASVARALFEAGVPIEIAVRVLTRPKDRRQYRITQPATSPA
jgi:hypothetical protein